MPSEKAWDYDANPYAEHWLSYLQEEMEEEEMMEEDADPEPVDDADEDGSGPFPKQG